MGHPTLHVEDTVVGVWYQREQTEDVYYMPSPLGEWTKSTNACECAFVPFHSSFSPPPPPSTLITYSILLIHSNGLPDFHSAV